MQTGFGELALLFSSPRAATCKAATTTAVWTIRGPLFRKVMQSTALRKREQYSSFLRTVPLLVHLSDHDIGVVADALHEVILEDGVPAVIKGENGDSLFIVKEGQIGAESDGSEVFWGPGDHFGEVSMLLDMPQPMTISAMGVASVLKVSRRTFKRIVSQPSAESQQVREVLRQNHIALDDATAAKLKTANDSVWEDSEDEGDETDNTVYPVILDKVENALDSSCMDLDLINGVLDEVDDEEFDHPAVGALVNKQEALEALLSGERVRSDILTGRADGE